MLSIWTGLKICRFGKELILNPYPAEFKFLKILQTNFNWSDNTEWDFVDENK